MLNTEAASVDATTEPISRLWVHSKPSARCTKTPTRPVVIATPRVDSRKDCTATGRASRILVPKPP